MVRCPQCFGDIPHDAPGARCPQCGAALTGVPTAGAGVVAAGARPRGGEDFSQPDYQLSARDPLGDARFAPGHIFAGRYRIVSLLGRGAMGEVYRADDLRIGRPIALKLLAVPAAREAQVQQFVAEVRLARDIAHPNVCRVYDIANADGWHYLSMEYVDGETLASLLRRVGRMPGEKAIDIARQLCEGLAAAHEVGVLHRDIKPSNIMIDGRGRVRLMDFGLAVPAGTPRTGEVAGTPAYMAPEQLAGDGATERTDLYALGLVLYEVFTGRQMFAARSFDDRRRFGFDAPTDAALWEFDPAVASTVRACLMPNPAVRPASARALTRLLPGGDALTAAIAEGRLLSPEMVAAAGERGELRPTYAWALCGAVVLGVLLVAARVSEMTQLSRAALPKPPDALIERAREILKVAGHDGRQGDSEHWFIAELESAAPAQPANARLRRTRFAFRQSPSYLLPQNLFRVVTADDPAPTQPGMASLNLDADGRLIELTIIPAIIGGAATTPPDWNALFAAAGLSSSEFLATAPDLPPAVPHDQQVAWSERSASAPRRVSAATLRGRPVYFGVTSDDASFSLGVQRPFSVGEPLVVEVTLWLTIVLTFSVAGVMARDNYRRGEGDRRGARRLSTFVIFLGALSALLRGHHVPNGIEEAKFLLSVTGWALVWGTFSWLVYMSLEPRVRRLWPATLISWARLLSGRVRDPMVGRDVLIGLAAGAALVSVRLLISEPAPNVSLIVQLDSLRSTRAFAFALLVDLLNAVQYALAGLFCLLLIRVVVRRTWIAAIVMALLSLPVVSGGTMFQSWALGGYAFAVAMAQFTVLMRIGLVAAAASLFCQLVLTQLPLTLDTAAWYFGYSAMTMLGMVSIAVFCAIVATAAAVQSPRALQRSISAEPTR